jgi:hypothetical protein
MTRGIIARNKRMAFVAIVHEAMQSHYHRNDASWAGLLSERQRAAVTSLYQKATVARRLCLRKNETRRVWTSPGRKGTGRWIFLFFIQMAS